MTRSTNTVWFIQIKRVTQIKKVTQRRHGDDAVVLHFCRYGRRREVERFAAHTRRNFTADRAVRRAHTDRCVLNAIVSKANRPSFSSWLSARCRAAFICSPRLSETRNKVESPKAGVRGGRLSIIPIALRARAEYSAFSKIDIPRVTLSRAFLRSTISTP